jgi:hypothetical protein
LNQWPSGHLIITLSIGPLVDSIVNLHRTSAGSPHLDASFRSRYSGQSRNVIKVSTIATLGGRRRWQHHGKP